jgi:putative phosphoesterase
VLLGILSDTHDRHARTALAIDMLRAAGAEALVHCGDFTSPEIIELLVGGPSWFVFGNNDEGYERALSRAADEVGAVSLGFGGLIELAGRTIAVSHGHVPSEDKRLTLLEPDYFLFGHSHAKCDERRGSTRFINPGAIHRAGEFSVALLNLKTDELQFLDVPR